VSLIRRVLTLTDHTRLSSESGERSAWYKEWHHFCILGPDVQAVVNFSLLGDNRPSAAPGARQARLTLLVHAAGWDGDVVEIPARDVELNPGRIDLRFGHNRLLFKDGVFRISAALQERPLTLDLALRPVTFPLLRNATTLGAGTIDWLVVPRLEASGTLVSGWKVHRLERIPAYHDHNWGHWLWGHDFAWEWGFALPVRGEAVWSLVYNNVTNRARSQVQEVKLSLWKGDKLERIFTPDEIEVRRNDYLARRGAPKFPRIMALVAPEMTTDVPECMEIRAVGSQDHLQVKFSAQEIAQLVVPNETDLGETIINEVIGTIQAEGMVKGQPVEIEGQGFFEFLT
jgi:hypothetical protein